jgi:hypothetical protein
MRKGRYWVSLHPRADATEVLRANKGLDFTKPFAIFVYNPLYERVNGAGVTCTSLKSAVHTLLSWLEKEPTHTGEVLIYKPKTKVMYQRIPSQ